MRPSLGTRSILLGLMVGLVFIPSLLATAGCNSDDGKDSEKTNKDRDRLSQMREKSGGDWSKLSDADKAYVIDIAHGDENSAHMLFNPKGTHAPRPGSGPAPSK